MTVLRSPFPGMDPYLEDPREWQSVHMRLITYLGEALSALVSPSYRVQIEERVYMTTPGDPDRSAIEPDVHIVQEVRAPYTEVSRTNRGITPPVMIHLIDYDPQIRDRFLEIRDNKNQELVTVIELLSPFNKRPGAQGYAAFQEKRDEVMATKVHWIEIDLLRAGARPMEVKDKSDYYALLKRGDRYWPWEAWFFNLRNPMPTIAVPLKAPDEDTPLDLQAVFHDMYARTRYAHSIDYSQPVPPPPLRPEDEAWAREQVEAWRLEIGD
ncbi:MAG: DUF4058 family protein [Caldilineaceae bacterium]|nr:DUF4058 family protein [Caldilineaceae bacterium]